MEIYLSPMRCIRLLIQRVHASTRVFALISKAIGIVVNVQKIPLSFTTQTAHTAVNAKTAIAIIIDVPLADKSDLQRRSTGRFRFGKVAQMDTAIEAGGW